MFLKEYTETIPGTTNEVVPPTEEKAETTTNVVKKPTAVVISTKPAAEPFTGFKENYIENGNRYALITGDAVADEVYFSF